MSAREREKWDAIHAERGFFPPAPSALLVDCRRYLPNPGGRALDLAGGTGRHALWLAKCGYSATLLDISQTALEIARVEASKRNLDLEIVCADLERDPFPDGPWDVIVCHHYLHRALFDRFACELSRDGILLFVQPTLRNLERHPKPSRRFLLKDGELSDLVSQSGLEVISSQEGWLQSGRHEALLVARRRDGEGAGR